MSFHPSILLSCQLTLLRLPPLSLHFLIFLFHSAHLSDHSSIQLYVLLLLCPSIYVPSFPPLCLFFLHPLWPSICLLSLCPFKYLICLFFCLSVLVDCPHCSVFLIYPVSLSWVHFISRLPHLTIIPSFILIYGTPVNGWWGTITDGTQVSLGVVFPTLWAGLCLSLTTVLSIALCWLSCSYLHHHLCN